jgi:hypothetical protein
MARSARIAVAAALLLTGTSLATAKIRGVGGGHGNFHRPGINETTSRPTAPYRGLYDFYSVPPYIPGYTYGHVKPGGW